MHELYFLFIMQEGHWQQLVSKDGDMWGRSPLIFKKGYTRELRYLFTRKFRYTFNNT